MANEPIPRATATAGAASLDADRALPPDAVRPRRVAAIVGALAAVWLLVLYAVHPLPDAVRACFGARDDFARRGGLHMVWAPPARFDRGQLATIDAATMRVDASGDDVVFEIGGVAPENVAAVARRLTDAPLEMHEVLESEPSEQLGRVAQGPVTADMDSWVAEEDLQRHRRTYLHGTRAQLAAALAAATRAGWAPPAGSHVAFEDAGDGRAYAGADVGGAHGPSVDPAAHWCAYLIADAAEITAADVRGAYVAEDPISLRPTVILELTDAGTPRFAEVTTRLRGHKLATTVGDEVRSAPVINTPITHGRASIMMGGSDRVQQQREAQELADTLHGVALPTGGHLVEAHYVPPVDGTVSQWLARLLLAALGGGVAGAFAYGVVRAVRPRVATRAGQAAGAAAGDRIPWRRLAATLVAPAVLLAVNLLPVPGAGRGDDDAAQSLDGLFRAFQPSHELCLGSLGITPVIVAMLLVELVATIVPSWRRRRHAGPEARAPFKHAAIALAAAIVVIQSRLLVLTLVSDQLGPMPIVRFIEIAASLGAGTLALAAAAWVVRRHGVGNGWVVLIASGLLAHLVVGELGPWGSGGQAVDIRTLAVAAATCVVVAVLVTGVLGWRVGARGEAALRVPTSGTLPMSDAAAIVSILQTLSLIGATGAAVVADRVIAALGGSTAVQLLLLVVMTLVWSFAFARPRLLEGVAARAQVAPAIRATWWRATWLSIALLAALAVVQMAAPEVGVVGDVAMVSLVVALALDAAADLRGRHRGQALVWSLHGAQHADLAAHALAEAGVAHHLSATRVRTLLAWFGPFAPIDVWVAPADADVARARLSALFVPAAAGVESEP